MCQDCEHFLSTTRMFRCKADSFVCDSSDDLHDHVMGIHYDILQEHKVKLSGSYSMLDVCDIVFPEILVELNLKEAGF